MLPYNSSDVELALRFTRLAAHTSQCRFLSRSCTHGRANMAVMECEIQYQHARPWTACITTLREVHLDSSTSATHVSSHPLLHLLQARALEWLQREIKAWSWTRSGSQQSEARFGACGAVLPDCVGEAQSSMARRGLKTCTVCLWSAVGCCSQSTRQGGLCLALLTKLTEIEATIMMKIDTSTTLNLVTFSCAVSQRLR